MQEEWLELSALIEQVQEYFDLGLYEKGVEILDQYKEIYNNDWEIHFLYSRAFAEQEFPSKAIIHLKQALKLDKNNADCLLGLFYAFTQLNKKNKGIRYLLLAYRLYPDNELILNAMIWYYTESNDYIRAISTYENAKNILDYNPEALRNIGIAYERVGENNKALICYKMSLELYPDSDETRDLLADYYILCGENKKSIDLYREHLANSPNNIRTLSKLVYCLIQNEELNKAEGTALQIIKTYPNSSVGYVDLSYVYLQSERVDKAIEMADKALDVSPIDAEPLRVKAIAYSEMGNNTLAEQNFHAALNISPDNPEIMRDFYHHLRNAEKYNAMEEMVLTVIKQEHPYCTEDYWFLADYYREKNENKKAFHYLIKAYRSMPGERDLIPPMVEILLDMDHHLFAVPILKHYIEVKGWDEVMKKLTTHHRLQGKRSQEGLRFLQFYGQKPVEFRKFIFVYYVRKAIIISLLLLFTLASIMGFIFFNTIGLIISFLLGTLCIFGIKNVKFFPPFRGQ